MDLNIQALIGRDISTLQEVLPMLLPLWGTSFFIAIVIFLLNNQGAYRRKSITFIIIKVCLPVTVAAIILDNIISSYEIKGLLNSIVLSLLVLLLYKLKTKEPPFKALFLSFIYFPCIGLGICLIAYLLLILHAVLIPLIGLYTYFTVRHFENSDKVSIIKKVCLTAILGETLIMTLSLFKL